MKKIGSTGGSWTCLCRLATHAYNVVSGFEQKNGLGALEAMIQCSHLWQEHRSSVKLQYEDECSECKQGVLKGRDLTEWIWPSNACSSDENDWEGGYEEDEYDATYDYDDDDW